MCIASLDQGNDLSGEEMMVAASPIADNAEVIEIYEPPTLIDPAINQFLTSAPLAVAKFVSSEWPTRRVRC
jgi:hypothetical protein